MYLLALLSRYGGIMEYYEMTNGEILIRLGERVQRKRLNKNISQQKLAKRAGVSRRSIYLMESGQAVGMNIFISILRALKSLDELDAFLPEVDLSPIELAKLKGRIRQRASGSRSKE